MPHQNNLRNLRWHKVDAIIKGNNTLSTSPYSIVEAILQDIKTILYWQNPFFFHINNHPFKTKTQKGHTMHLSIILINHTQDEAQLFTSALHDYFQDPWNSRNISLIEISPPKLRKGIEIINENPLSEVSYKNEISVEFLTPLPFKPLHPKKRCYIGKSEFLSLIYDRLDRLFPNIEKPLVDENAFEILPYWCYDELIMPSTSQPGHNRYINGCIGKVYFKGNLSEIIEPLAVCSELHAGTSLSYARGYYIIHRKSSSYISSLPILKELQFYLEKNKEELKDQNITEIAKQLANELTQGTYTPTPYQAFKPQGADLLTGKLHWKDRVIQSLLYKILKNPIDNILPLSVVSFRPHISEEDIMRKIQEAQQLGLNRTLTFSIKNFYASVDHDKLIKILNRYIPLHDSFIIETIRKILKSGYILENTLYETQKGLPPASPLSPLLSNLYLIDIDKALTNQETQILRHADTYLIMSTSHDILTEKLQLARQILKDLNLLINENTVKFGNPSEPIKFAGIMIHSEQKEKTLRKPLYITKPETHLNLSSDTLQVSTKKQNPANYPLNRINEIVITTDTTLTTPLIRECARLNIPITISSTFNNTIAFLRPAYKSHYDSVTEHTKTYQTLSQETLLLYAKQIASLKIKSYEILFSKKKILTQNLKSKLSQTVHQINQAQYLDTVRGYEAISTRQIYSELNKLIKIEAFHIKKRKRENPDPINSLMNILSHLTFNRIRTLVYAYSLNPYLGFLHSPQNNYESLVADLHELMRAKMDSLLIKVINQNIIKISDFEQKSGRYILKSPALQKFILIFEDFMNTYYNTEYRTIHDYLTRQIRHIKDWATRKTEEITFEIPW